MDLTNIIGNLCQKRRRYSACLKINWTSRTKQLGCTETSKKRGSDRHMTCGILWNQLYLWWLKLNSNMKRQPLSKRNGDFKQNNCVGLIWLLVEPPPWTVWVPGSYPRWQIEDHQRSSASQGLGEFSTRCPLSVSCDISAKSSTDLRMSSPCVCFFLYSYIYIYIPYGSKYLLRKCLGYNLLWFGSLSTFSDSVWIHRDMYIIYHIPIFSWKLTNIGCWLVMSFPLLSSTATYCSIPKYINLENRPFKDGRSLPPPKKRARFMLVGGNARVFDRNPFHHHHHHHHHHHPRLISYYHPVYPCSYGAYHPYSQFQKDIPCSFH